MSKAITSGKKKIEVAEKEAEPGEPEDGGGEPGARRHGNFINYYQFHPAEERLRQLPEAVCQQSRATSGAGRKYVALDVGCNAGNLTLELHKYLSAKLPSVEVSILGIDLDPVLIERARQQNDRPDLVSFECLDFLSSERESFVAAYLSERQVARFDASFCFSITMWVHLNAGDIGLERFLRDVCACSEAVLIEPQPWRCYRNAARRMRRAEQADFPLLPKLAYRADVEQHVQRIVEQAGMRLLEVSERNDWQRRLLYYVRSAEQHPDKDIPASSTPPTL